MPNLQLIKISKLKIFNITDKVGKSVVDKINSNLEKNYKSIEVFNVGMYLNDELIDIGEGNYLLNNDDMSEAEALQWLNDNIKIIDENNLIPKLLIEEVYEVVNAYTA